MTQDSTSQEPTFFATPAELRAWFVEHHADSKELWLGFYKKGSGRPSITWPEAVDEALCFGWIDGIRKSIDAESYKNRLTPRKKGSTWSAVNIARVAELERQGRMMPEGLRAFAARIEAKSGIYAYEQRGNAQLDQAAEEQFKADPQAWAFFNSRPLGYRRTAIWWVVSAKQAATRQRRLAQLIADSAAGRTIPSLTRTP